MKSNVDNKASYRDRLQDIVSLDGQYTFQWDTFSGNCHFLKVLSK